MVHDRMGVLGCMGVWVYGRMGGCIGVWAYECLAYGVWCMAYGCVLCAVSATVSVGSPLQFLSPPVSLPSSFSSPLGSNILFGLMLAQFVTFTQVRVTVLALAATRARARRDQTMAITPPKSLAVGKFATHFQPCAGVP
jgi:hypothetical protein